MTRRLAILALLPLAAALAGCAGARSHITVSRYDALASRSADLHFVGVVPGVEYDRYLAYPVAKYWREDDLLRKEADKAEIHFFAGLTSFKEILEEDPCWQRWLNRGVTHVIVFADIPGVPDTQNAKLVIPLARDRYLPWYQPGHPELAVSVRESGVYLETPLRP